MRVINEIKGAQNKEISDTLTQILSSRTGYGCNMFPLIFTVHYVRDQKDGVLVPHYSFGMLQNPAYIYDSYTERFSKIHLATAHNKYFRQIGNHEQFNAGGDIIIPRNLKIVDVEKMLGKENHENVSGIIIAKDENIFNLYIGDPAFDCLAKLNNYNNIEI